MYGDRLRKFSVYAKKCTLDIGEALNIKLNTDVIEIFMANCMLVIHYPQLI